MAFYGAYTVGDEGLAQFYAMEVPKIEPTQADIDQFHANQKAKIMANVATTKNRESLLPLNGMATYTGPVQAKTA